MNYDLMRSLGGGKPWLLMEQAPSAVSWRAVNVPKTPDQRRLWSLQTVARGADGVMHFQWRASRAGRGEVPQRPAPARRHAVAGMARDGALRRGAGEADGGRREPDREHGRDRPGLELVVGAGGRGPPLGAGTAQGADPELVLAAAPVEPRRRLRAAGRGSEPLQGGAGAEPVLGEHRERFPAVRLRVRRRVSRRRLLQRDRRRARPHPPGCRRHRRRIPRAAEGRARGGGRRVVADPGRPLGRGLLRRRRGSRAGEEEAPAQLRHRLPPARPRRCAGASGSARPPPGPSRTTPTAR